MVIKKRGEERDKNKEVILFLIICQNIEKSKKRIIMFTRGKISERD